MIGAALLLFATILLLYLLAALVSVVYTMAMHYARHVWRAADLTRERDDLIDQVESLRGAIAAESAVIQARIEAHARELARIKLARLTVAGAELVVFCDWLQELAEQKSRDASTAKLPPAPHRLALTMQAETPQLAIIVEDANAEQACAKMAAEIKRRFPWNCQP